MRMCQLVTAVLLLLSCVSETKRASGNQQEVTYAELLKCALEVDTLQPYFYRLPDGAPYPLIIADDYLSLAKNPPAIEKFGRRISFISLDSADRASLPAYFYVTEYLQYDSIGRVMLTDPVRHIYFGASFQLSVSGWRLESAFVEKED